MGGFIQRLTSGVTVGVVTAIMTTAVVAGGLAFAAGVESVPNNSVNSAKIVNGSIQSIDVKNGTLAAIDMLPELRPRWLAQEPGGVGLENEIIASRGEIVSSTQTAVGVYVVDFASSVVGCAFVATLQQGSSSSAPGEITAARHPSDPSAVVVRTYGSGGVPADQEAHSLQVLC